MSLDARLSSILDDAMDALRTSLRDTAAVAFSTLPLPATALRDVAQKAYELGYREALAARGERSAASQQVASESGETRPHSETANGHEGNSDSDRLEQTDNAAADVPGEEADESLLDSSPRTTAASGVDWSGFDEDDDSSGETAAAAREAPSRPRAAPPLRIFPHATISTLRQRIIDTFDLERFDIDVVVCRRGDRNRRQLKGSVKLSKYMVEG